MFFQKPLLLHRILPVIKDGIHNCYPTFTYLSRPGANTKIAVTLSF